MLTAAQIRHFGMSSHMTQLAAYEAQESRLDVYEFERFKALLDAAMRNVVNSIALQAEADERGIDVES